MSGEGLELYNGQDKEKVERSPKQQYKQRAKWVMNIGSKPDLPDGTLVKAVFDEGGVIAEVDKLRWSIADHIGQTNIVKWKLADDWNKVVNGQAPDIDGDTLVEVVWIGKLMYLATKHHTAFQTKICLPPLKLTRRNTSSIAAQRPCQSIPARCTGFLKAHW